MPSYQTEQNDMWDHLKLNQTTLERMQVQAYVGLCLH